MRWSDITARFELNRSCFAGNILLTGDPPERQQKGSLWFKSYPLPIYQAFETSFHFRIGANDAVLNGGDGITFVIQNSSAGTRALGGTYPTSYYISTVYSY